MVEHDSWTAKLVSGAVQVLAIVVIGVVAGAIVTNFAGRLEEARLLASIAAALATVVLAGLTGYYASSARSYMEDARKEQRRPYVKRIVATGLDRLRDWLAESRDRWDVENPPQGMPVYPELDSVAVTDDVIADLGRRHPDLVRTLSEYRSVHRQYRNAWSTLVDDLDRYLRREFSFEDPPDRLDDVVPEGYTHLEHGAESDPGAAPESFVADHSQLFARFVLTNPEVDLDGASALDDEDYARLLFDARRREFVNVRGADPVGDRIDLVHRHLEHLKDGQGEIERRLEEVREEYVTEYDIMETELGEIRDGGRVAV